MPELRVPGPGGRALFTAAEIAAATGGELVRGAPETPVFGVAADSRVVRPGDLFVAIPGERADGHDFAGAALAAGAAAALVARWPLEGADPPGREDPAKAVVRVADTRRGLGWLARAHRRRFDLPVVGVTGSVGKTTTKDLIASALAPRLPTLATEASFNTEVTLPLTLFRLDAGHRAAVLEMGMRGRGQIAWLASLAEPSVGVITRIGESHLELLGSIENVAEAKGELLQALPETGLAVLNGDDLHCRRLGERSRCRVVHFGLGEGCAVAARDVAPLPGGGSSFTCTVAPGPFPGAAPEGVAFPVALSLPGRHNVANALAAVAVALHLGVEPAAVAAGLAAPRLTGMRMEIRRRGATTILDDTYNASPTSVRAALEVLADWPARRRVAVLGDMLELGPASEEGHREVGRHAAAAGLDLLVTVGQRARDIAAAARREGMPADRIWECGDGGEALEVLRPRLAPGDAVLVKGSRAMRMERIARELEAGLPGGEEGP